MASPSLKYVRNFSNNFEGENLYRKPKLYFIRRKTAPFQSWIFHGSIAAVVSHGIVKEDRASHRAPEEFRSQPRRTHF